MKLTWKYSRVIHAALCISLYESSYYPMHSTTQHTALKWTLSLQRASKIICFPWMEYIVDNTRLTYGALTMLNTLFVSQHQFFDGVGKYKLLVFKGPFFQDVCTLFTPFRVRRLKVTTHIKLPNLHERYHNNKKIYKT